MTRDIHHAAHRLGRRAAKKHKFFDEFLPNQRELHAGDIIKLAIFCAGI